MENGFIDFSLPKKTDEALAEALDKGIESMQMNRVTPHEESMKILFQRLDEYALLNSGNG